MSKSSKPTSGWKWTDDDLGWAYIRYCDSTSRTILPANFIHGYVKGKPVDTRYKYKVFWCEESDARNTPVKYLKTAARMPLFEDEGDAVANFGEPGCYRALVYVVKDTLEELNTWIANNRIKEPSGKLAYLSFRLGSTQSSPDETQSGKSTSKSNKETSENKASAAPRNHNKKKKGSGSLNNTKDIREKLLGTATLKPNSKNGKDDKKSEPKKVVKGKVDENPEPKKVVIKGKDKKLEPEKMVIKGKDKKVEPEKMVVKGKDKKPDEPEKVVIQEEKKRQKRKRDLSYENMDVDVDDNDSDPTIPSPRKVRALEAELSSQRKELRKATLIKERLRNEIAEHDSHGHSSQSKDETTKDTMFPAVPLHNPQDHPAGMTAKQLYQPNSLKVGKQEFKISNDFCTTKDNMQTLWDIGPGDPCELDRTQICSD